jgi:hypothetical protein
LDDQPIEAPALAEVLDRYSRLPPWLRDGPFAVEPDLWQRAKTEMDVVMSRRGFHVPKADLDQPNFILYGIPIVMAGQ